MLAAAVPGARWQQATVSGPGRARVVGCWLELPDRTAVVELARASGLPLLASPDPMGAHTAGTGELIGRALDAGAARIVLGLGGSASTDGGTGALTALGARFLDAAGTALPPGGGALGELASADLSGLRPPPLGGLTCLTDVTAPLLGPPARPPSSGRRKARARPRRPRWTPGWPGSPGCSAATRRRRARARRAAPDTVSPPPGAPSSGPAPPS